MDSFHLYDYDGRYSEALLDNLKAGWKFTYKEKTNKLTQQYDGLESFLKRRYLLG
jgi:hypothetical protein